MISLSVLIITHAREDLLVKCINSILAQEDLIPCELILVLNGQHLTEKTHQVVMGLENKEIIVKIISLPTKESPGRARNIGLKNVSGDWVFFLDDDAYLLKGYFQRSLSFLTQESDRVDIVGGPDTMAMGMGHFASALAVTLSSVLCTGPTHYRHKKKGKIPFPANEKILSSCNLWIRKKILDEDPFPEDYLRGEETYLLLYLQGKKARMFYHPQLMVAHHRRQNLKSLFWPIFYSGFYRSKNLYKETSSSRYLFCLPAIFVLIHLVLFIDFHFMAYFFRLYFSVVLMMAINLSNQKRKPSLFLTIGFLHYFIVTVYGLGFLYHRLNSFFKIKKYSFEAS